MDTQGKYDDKFQEINILFAHHAKNSSSNVTGVTGKKLQCIN